jgi:5-methylcytosine-specific restriction endonuclease McrA
MTTQALVLDIGNHPIETISWSDAVDLLFRGAAEVVESYDECFYTNEMDISVYDIEKFGPLGRFFDEELLSEDRVRVEMKRPAVVRIMQSLIGLHQVKFSRHGIFQRDEYECQYEGCKTTKAWFKRYGTRTLPAKMLTFEHVFPESRGGKTTWQNIVTACGPCNNKKDNRTPDEAGMVLRREPFVPKNLPVVSSRVQTPDEWRNWLYWNAELKS